MLARESGLSLAHLPEPVGGVHVGGRVGGQLEQGEVEVRKLLKANTVIKVTT